MPTFELTTATKKIIKLDKRIRAVAGGTAASKTISILMWLIDYAESHNGELITIVSESYPHLKRGAMLDFETIMKDFKHWEPARWNKTEHTYTFDTGSKIEFFSVDFGAAHGPRRDVLYINEANNLDYKTVDQLITRTRKIVWMDWNPTNEFWFYTEMQPNRDDIDFLTLTYKDNEALDPIMRGEIESHRYNKAWWKVYGEGKLGEVEGQIFRNWKLIDEVPHEARLEVGGGDFGYARDRTAFCDIYYYNGGYIIDEIVSRVGFKDTDLANMLSNRQNPNLLYIGDSADKQKIDVMQDMGVNITGVEKKGSNGEKFTNAAISFVQDQQISLTKRSLNYIKSYRNFMWQTDRDGEIIPKYDHFMSDEMMSVIYGMTHFRPRVTEDEPVYTSGNLTSLW
jgi:phage terminase large subunit